MRYEVVKLIEQPTLRVSGEDEVELVEDLPHVLSEGELDYAYHSF